MLVRGALAALDHNTNCGRGQAETKDGRTRLDLVKNRVGNKWFIRKVLVQKDHTWREDIAYLVIKVGIHNKLQFVQPKYHFQSLDTGRMPPIELPVGSEEFIVRKAIPRPIKEDAVKKHQSRLVQL